MEPGGKDNLPPGTRLLERLVHITASVIRIKLSPCTLELHLLQSHYFAEY
jgi:hypothetical protein